MLEALAFSTALTAALAVVVLLVFRRSLAGFERAVHQPWWMLLGGVMRTAHRLHRHLRRTADRRRGDRGILIAGQLVAGAAIDRWGLLGSERIPLHWPRLLGLALLAAGAALSLKK